MREKITVLRGNWKETLLELVDAENLPEAYGGTDTLKGGEGPEEDAMRQFVRDHCGEKDDDSAQEDPLEFVNGDGNDDDKSEVSLEGVER